MEYRMLGNTGTVVSTLCLGTMTFGAESDEQVAPEQLDRFLEQGGNFVDAADVYGDGESETIIGRWLGTRSGARDRAVIATKGRFPRGEGPKRGGAVPGQADPGTGGEPAALRCRHRRTCTRRMPGIR